MRLADEEVPTITVNARTRWAIGTSNSAYELQGNLDGQRYPDVYAVDTKTGQKKVVKKKLRWGNGASPDGTKYLYYENQHFWVFDAETGTDAQHHDGRADELHRHRRRPQRRRSADERARLDVGQCLRAAVGQLGHLESSGRRRASRP